ncbi:Fis family transcriptional regulator [Ectothiorhodospira haloalkaliphila]|uniref:Putative Fis-like DNA-binding protein n=1 Tax=Ectothiorhodospira haloalkaliphila TaxID=421628 RepID=W8KU16_9GAMM|nr:MULTISPECIES: DNA-binding transcriptional regulator Fis [Ectothiorhodospira]AHK79066.1 Fis family transcriptional regulator [Ectothiorhodospira haloalkaliphila]MCG5494843.1 DNA-binding transcriptional regulator Fis [Ectothiorhodospira variabilis]MCG5504268.1 DNA-binding transcriptional regulator Fis [Ectothiorhodospira variabilis]MCG5507423.1 DNA-binding transcriptional regulator Fis [Ectothiorhodospira variabilis]
MNQPSVESTQESETLAVAVEQALTEYFAKLDGHEPDNLYRMVIEEVERPLLECVLRHCDGNQSRAAQYLGLNRGTLRKKLRQYELG